MSWTFRVIPKEIKEQILTNIKNNGKTVANMSEEYWVAVQTIYTWLKQDTEYNNSKSWWYSRSAVLEINKLKKEKQELVDLVGKLTVLANRIKKKELIF